MSYVEFYVACLQLNFVNGLAVPLAQFDTNISARRAAKAQLVWRSWFVQTPAQLCPEPTDKQKTRWSETWREINSHSIDLGQAVMGRGMIEELSERKAHVVQSRPIQIAKHDALTRLLAYGFQQAHLRAKIVPALAVID